ncbi:MAG: hypothetical protein FIB01_02815 [Gemmatimonadetes bacterium]|nr:hypothetical protein [Gemmatimonadota bacterium]
MYTRVLVACAAAAIWGAAPANGQGTPERVVVNYNDDGMAKITPAVIDGFLRALYAEQAAGGDFWKSGGFDFSIEFRKVEERIQAFLAIAFQGTKAAIFAPEELAALEARRKDLEAASKRDWANVNLGAGLPAAPAPAPTPAQPTPQAQSTICAQLDARMRELAPQLNQRMATMKEETEWAEYFDGVAERLRERGRPALIEVELSSALLQADAAKYGLAVTPEMRDSPYTFYLMLARAARERADWLGREFRELPVTLEYSRLEGQRLQNNCVTEREP